MKEKGYRVNYILQNFHYLPEKKSFNIKIKLSSSDFKKGIM